MIKNNYTDLAILLLRITFGASMIIGHGWKKFMQYFGDEPLKFGDPIGLGVELSLALAVFAEVFCAFLLIIGLFTRYATIPLIITMAVAVFVVHIDDSFSKLEKPILFMVAYLSLFLTGAGKYSVDAQLSNKFKWL